MSESKKLSPIQVVQRYHERYLEFEAAFNKNPFNEQELQNQLKEVVESDLDVESEEFLEKMVGIMIEKPQKRADVNNAALKFSMFADFYMLTQEEELPESLLKDYESLPIKDSLKPFFSIKDGEFVRNEEQEISEDMKNYFKAIINQVKIQEV